MLSMSDKEKLEMPSCRLLIKLNTIQYLLLLFTFILPLIKKIRSDKIFDWCTRDFVCRELIFGSSATN